MPKIAFLFNPHSKRNKRHLPAMLEVVGRFAVESHRLDKKSDLPHLIADLAARDIEWVLVAGGDGTVQTVVTAIGDRADWSPKLILIGGGMTNAIAQDIGEKRRPLPALQATLPPLLAGEGGMEARRRTILWREEGVTLHCGFLVGALSFYSATLFSRREVHRLGVAQMLAANLSLFWSALHAMFGKDGEKGVLAHERIRFRVNDGQEEERLLSLFLMTTLHRLLPLAHPFWGKEDAPLRTTLIAHPPFRLWQAALPALAGRPKAWMLEEGRYRSFNAHRVELSLASPAMMDGETILPHKNPILLEAGPHVEFRRFP